jgi:hypothetical protein
MLELEAETVYALGVSGYFLYMVHNLDDTEHCEGYAQIVNQDDLDDLLNDSDDEDEDEDDEDEDEEETPQPAHRYPPARRDDDSGNDNEYL